MNVIGYLRVSTRDQDYGIEVQRGLILAEAERRGWTVTFIEDQGETGKNTERPGLKRAVSLLARGDYDALVVSKLDRLSRSVVDFGNLLRTATRPGKRAKRWGIVALDLGIDMTTPTGRLLAHILIAVAEWEGDIISERTQAGLAEAKRKGVRLGAPSRQDPKVVARVATLRENGYTLQAIADELNASDTPLPGGGTRWYPASVRCALKSAA